MSAAATYVCRQFVEDVTDYLEGVLPDDIVILVELHLADCPHCREYLAQMRRTITMTRELTSTTSTPCPTTSVNASSGRSANIRSSSYPPPGTCSSATRPPDPSRARSPARFHRRAAT